LFIIVSAALSVLAGWGFARLENRFRTRLYRWLLAGVAVTLIAVESATIPIYLVPVPAPDPIYLWLAQQPPSVVLEWPLPKTNNLGYTFDPSYMYYSTGHWQRLVNGYSGFHPSSYVRLLDALTPFPNPTGIEALRKLGVDYLILHRELAPEEWNRVNDALRASPGVRLVMSDSSMRQTVAVYQIVGVN
jgi:hypothetical protein